jgi:DNA-binding CsgD family transcriptional regulator
MGQSVGGMDQDAIIRDLYRAGAGRVPWTDPLDAITRVFGLWVVQFFAVDKRSGTVIFSHEGGKPAPEVALDWFREYHRIDPRAALMASSSPGEWIACDEHFDDDYVAKSPFYQNFLLPYGGRYVYGVKLAEDEKNMVAIAFHRGHDSPQLDHEERAAVRRLAQHVLDAYRMQLEIGRASEVRALGLAVLERMRQPLMILDANRRIAFTNEGGSEVLARGELIVDRDGFAVCRDAESDVDLMMALRELSLLPGAPDGDANLDRRGVRLRRVSGDIVAGTLLALRPHRVLGAFGTSNLALLAIYEPEIGGEIDPFLLSTTFDLTPAEARVASHVAAGRVPKEIAVRLGVQVNTVRSQLNSILAKTGTRRQAELVRVLLLAQEF